MILLSASAAPAQTPVVIPSGESPTFTVQVWGAIDPEFNARVGRYYALRLHLEEGLPPPSVTDDFAEIWRAELALGQRVRAARDGARQGDLFTPATTTQFRQALLLVMTATTWAVIMDDNPGEFSHRINGAYPKNRPRSTVPYVILAQLPTLPDGIEYRFLGRHLILHDTRANVILDRIVHAIKCSDCDD